MTCKTINRCSLFLTQNAPGLVDTEALIKGLRSGVVGMAGLDVYEYEASYFFRDCSHTPVQAGLFLPLSVDDPRRDAFPSPRAVALYNIISYTAQ